MRSSPSDRREKLEEKLEKILKVAFFDRALIHNALVHSSYVNESGHTELESNEKLEFLGDAVLSLVISEHLVSKFSDFSEGELSRIKSVIISEKSLASCARKLKLARFLLLGRGAIKTEIIKRDSILSDTLEALIGAMYLDQGIGYGKTRAFILEILSPLVQDVQKKKLGLDYKTILQEYTQKLYRDVPSYRVLSIEGPEHEKLFTVSAGIRGGLTGTGTGSTKKEAEQAAARQIFHILQREELLENNN